MSCNHIFLRFAKSGISLDELSSSFFPRYKQKVELGIRELLSNSITAVTAENGVDGYEVVKVVRLAGSQSS